jgi:putative tryptophan/tyrosine transport system substrate-binding protein
MRTIVILHSGSNKKGFHANQITALMNGLASVGVDQTNTDIQKPVFAKDAGKSLQALADDLVAILAAVREAKVFVAAGGTRCAKVAMNATAGTNIPVVFTTFRDPDPPAPNMTGACARTTELDETRLRLLHEYLPAGKDFGVLVNTARGDYAPGSPARVRLDRAATAMKLNALDYQDVNLADVSIGSAFKGWAAAGKNGALVTADPFFNDNRDDVVNKATIPAIYQWRQFVEMNGLMSYGPKIDEAYRTAGIFGGLIINGTPVANLPVALITSSELVINGATAKTFPKTPTPQTLLGRAEVI